MTIAYHGEGGGRPTREYGPHDVFRSDRDISDWLCAASVVSTSGGTDRTQRAAPARSDADRPPRIHTLIVRHDGSVRGRRIPGSPRPPAGGPARHSKAPARHLPALKPNPAAPPAPAKPTAPPPIRPPVRPAVKPWRATPPAPRAQPCVAARTVRAAPDRPDRHRAVRGAEPPSRGRRYPPPSPATLPAPPLPGRRAP